jgi:hypothetical protein
LLLLLLLLLLMLLLLLLLLLLLHFSLVYRCQQQQTHVQLRVPIKLRSTVALLLAIVKMELTQLCAI